VLPHSATATRIIEAIGQPKFELLPHPRRSPDVVLSHYHVFGPIKEALCGGRFACDVEVKDVVRMWLWSPRKTFFTNEIRRFVDLRTMCVEKRGD
jgi:hypothetical protein